MSVKTPIRTVFDGSGNATGLAEYQSGEFIGLTHGGIGASLSIGSAGQVLKVNTGGSALEFGNVEAVINIDGMTDGSGDALVAGDKIPFSDGGTEKFTTPANIDTFISTTAKTLENKTISSADNTLTISGAQATLTAIGNSSLTNSSFNIVDDSSTTSTISLGESLKIAGTSNEIETAISGDQVTIGLPNDVTIGRDLTVTRNAVITGNLTVSGTTTTVNSSTIAITNSFTFEGATADAHETTLGVIDPTADRTINLPNATGTVVIQDSSNNISSSINSLTATTFTDGTASLSSGSLTSAVNGTFSGTVNATTDVQVNSVSVATKPFAIAQSIALG